MTLDDPYRREQLLMQAETIHADRLRWWEQREREQRIKREADKRTQLLADLARLKAYNHEATHA